MGTISVKAPRERQPGPMPGNRVCSKPECQTILSRYNVSDRCGPCGGWPRQRIVKNVDDLHELIAA